MRSLTKRQEKNARTNASSQTTKIINRLGKQALGTLTRKTTVEGEVVNIPYTMNQAEIRAAEIILKKTLPDLTMIQQVEPNQLDNMSREELGNLLLTLVEKNPMLAQLSGITEAVNKANTVADVTPILGEVVADVIPIEYDANK